MAFANKKFNTKYSYQNPSNKKLLHRRVKASVCEAHEDVEEVDLEERPARPDSKWELFPVRLCFAYLLVAYWLDAAFRHHPESCHAVVCLERRFNSANQIVRFQHEQHLSINFLENVRDVRKHQSSTRQQQFLLIVVGFFLADSRHYRLPRPTSHHASKHPIKIALDSQVERVMSHCFAVDAQDAEPKLCVFIAKAIGKILEDERSN